MHAEAHYQLKTVGRLTGYAQTCTRNIAVDRLKEAAADEGVDRSGRSTDRGARELIESKVICVDA